MGQNILDTSTQQYVGLNDSVYSTQPPNKNNFRYTIDIEFNKEPENIFEELVAIVNLIINR